MAELRWRSLEPSFGETGDTDRDRRLTEISGASQEGCPLSHNH